jgi:anti-anti-sigma regulatory factor
MNASLNISSTSLLLSLSGKLDYQGSLSAEDIFSKLKTREQQQLIIDVRQINDINSRGLLLFKQLSEVHIGNGAPLHIKGASHFFREAFELAGIDDMFIWLEDG